MADEKKASAQDVIDTLRSIDNRLKALMDHFGAGWKPQGESQTVRGEYVAPRVASDRDLDSQYGDPEVKAKDPRDWTGPPMKGNHFSQCPPEYLDLLADRLDFFLSKNEDDLASEENIRIAAIKANDDEAIATALANIDKLKKNLKYNRLDTSRARGWAARKRNGWTAPPQPEGFPSDSAPVEDDSIPF